MSHWTEGKTGERFTPEAKAVLAEKFETEDDAIIGYVELQKSAGKPFKLPKTMDAVDHWPDQRDKDAFNEGIKKLRGGVQSEDDLKDVDFGKGLADSRNVNEDMKKVVMAYAVKHNMSKEAIEELILSNNQIFTQQTNAISKLAETAKTEATKAVADELNTLFGGETGVKRNRENVYRMFTNHAGLSADESKAVLDQLDSSMAQNLALSKGSFNLAKPYVESKTEITEDQTGTKEQTDSQKDIKMMPDTAKALNWTS
ncbi:hypothetical protein LCGC14_2201440 [marine sediment metagenome]|uniref:Uncharacterized protein n=1 Tax=marine sediment metagenome TaxID=412755 RepID=A0A0F9DGS4_9ZZZZ